MSVFAEPLAQVEDALVYLESITLSLGPGERTTKLASARAALDLIEQRAKEMEDKAHERAKRASAITADAYQARVQRAEQRVVALIRLAHDRHLATGDYITLGIAAQDALSEFDRAALSAREEQK